jgi:hypothetical protein
VARERHRRRSAGDGWHAAVGVACDARKRAPEHGFGRGLVLHEEEDKTNLARGLREWFGWRSGHHGRRGGRHKAGEQREVLRFGVK